MPLYDFICMEYDHPFEGLEKIVSRNHSQIICPKCGSMRVIRKTVYATSIAHAFADHAPTPPVGFLGKAPNVVMRDCKIINCGTGMSLNNSSVEFDGLEISKTKTAIKSKNSQLKGRRLKIT